MKNIIWIWKFRHRWKDIRELVERLPDIRKIMLKLHMESIYPQWKDEDKACLAKDGGECWAWLQYCLTSKVKTLRPWKISSSVGGKVEPPHPWPKRLNMPCPKRDVSQ